MLNEKRSALVLGEALFKPNLAAFDLRENLLELREALFKILRRSLRLFCHCADCTRNDAHLELTVRSTALSIDHMPASAVMASLQSLPATLAQDTGTNAIRVLGWSLVLIALVVCAFVGVLWIRKWMKADDLPSGSTGFGLSELRALHRRGQLTDAEFERARDKITSAAKAVTSQMTDPAGGRRAPGMDRSTDAAGPDNTSRPDRGR